jgi:spermidine synthase
LADPTGRGLTLVIDGHVHGHVDAADPGRLELDYQARLATIALALLPPGPASVVHLGGGAVAVPRAMAAHRTDLDQLVMERSAAVIRLAERELGLRAAEGLRVRRGDARAGLARLGDASADLVVGDAFVDDRTPPHLATVEFLADVRRVLRPGGAYVVNVIDEQPWGRLAAHAATAAAVFDDIAAAGSRGVARLRDPGNAFLLAAAGRLPRDRVVRAGAVARHPVALVADGQLQALVRRSRPRHDADG